MASAAGAHRRAAHATSRGRAPRGGRQKQGASATGSGGHTAAGEERKRAAWPQGTGLRSRARTTILRGGRWYESLASRSKLRMKMRRCHAETCPHSSTYGSPARGARPNERGRSENARLNFAICSGTTVIVTRMAITQVNREIGSDGEKSPYLRARGEWRQLFGSALSRSWRARRGKCARRARTARGAGPHRERSEQCLAAAHRTTCSSPSATRPPRAAHPTVDAVTTAK